MLLLGYHVDRLSCLCSAFFDADFIMSYAHVNKGVKKPTWTRLRLFGRVNHVSNLIRVDLINPNAKKGRVKYALGNSGLGQPNKPERLALDPTRIDANTNPKS